MPLQFNASLLKKSIFFKKEKKKKLTVLTQQRQNLFKSQFLVIFVWSTI